MLNHPEPLGDVPIDQPVRRPRVSDEIVQRLQSAIVRGVYRVGGQLPSERELMKIFKVGRPAVREALFTLNRMGLVELRSGTPPLVTEPKASAVFGQMSSFVRHLLADDERVRQFQDVRMLFEVALVRDAAQNATASELRRIEKALERNGQAIGKREEFVRTDVEFHYAIAERTGNPLIADVHEAMSAWLHEQRGTALAVPGIEPLSHAEHRAIFEAIAQRDPDEAERRMRKHLLHVAKNYWQARKAG